MKTHQVISFQAPVEWAGLRLDKALAQHPEVSTRSRAEKLIELDCVQVQGVFPKASLILRGGEVITLQLPIKTNELLPLDLPLDILFEDKDVLVVNKPAGLVVHPAEGHEQDTLVNAILFHTSDLSMGFHEKRPGIVHRLDKDTSGLIVVAKNDRAHEFLSRQFQSRQVHRVYWALVYGKPRATEGRITSHLARDSKDRKRFASAANGGKYAITNYKLIKSHKDQISLVHVRLETGRTHQIRVHLSELGHPIVGDTLYAAPRYLKSIPSSQLRNQIQSLNRFVLHAAELGFIHPTDGNQLRFSVGWPKSLEEFVQTLDLAGE